MFVDQFARREGIHEAVHDDVAGIFKGKTYSQLIALEKQIYSKISSGDAVDIGKGFVLSSLINNDEYNDVTSWQFCRCG